MKYKEKTFVLLLITSVVVSLTLVAISNKQQSSELRIDEQISESSQHPEESDLTLPSIYQWLPNTQMKPESLVPKFKMSKNR